VLISFTAYIALNHTDFGGYVDYPVETSVPIQILMDVLICRRAE